MKPEKYPAYLDMVMANPPEKIRAELDRIISKVMDGQKISEPSSPIGRILFR